MKRSQALNIFYLLGGAHTDNSPHSTSDNMADLDWTKYSEPESDLAPHLSKLPHLVFTLESVPEARKQARERLAITQNAQRHLLPAGS